MTTKQAQQHYSIADIPAGEKLTLEAMAGLPASFHIFEPEHVRAIQAAYYAQRPLLVRGEPGLGKSQLAQALAQCLGWNLLTHVVHSATEPDDLLFRVDHVARLAKAQLVQAGQVKKKLLAHKHFVVPGPLWWAYAPGKAQAFFNSTNNDYTTNHAFKTDTPFVLLLDEIDKAPRDLPNSLLEILNNQSFNVPHLGEPIELSAPRLPFVVVTSNDEKPLPDAFLRRCTVLKLTLPEGKEGIQRLVNIAQTHEESLTRLDNEIIREAASLVIDYRDNLADGEYRPGTSEFLDLLKVLNNHEGYQSPEDRLSALTEMKKHFLEK